MFEHYKGRRVLVTGHTGFKGSWLIHWLKLLGAEICGVALAPDTKPALFELVGGARGIRSDLFDVADGAALRRTISQFQPQTIFHLAAQSLVRRSYQNPVQTLMTNVMGTAEVLDAARASSCVRAVLVVTSDKVYRNLETGRRFGEEDPLGGEDPYSASKAAAEIVTGAWRASFFKGAGAALVASARAGNVFGGGDWCEDRLLPDIARAIAAGQPVVLRNPEAIRPWQYVLEALCGYLMLGARLGEGEAGFAQGWNFGPLDDGVMTVADFAALVVGAWGRGEVVRQPDPQAPKEARTLRLDSAKSIDRLGWKPVLALDEAIRWSVEWYRDVLADPARAPDVSSAQIRAFSARLEQAGIRG